MDLLKSIDIIPPSTAPRRILLDSPILARQLFSHVLNAPIGGFTRKIIITPISKIPKNGYNSTGFVPSNDFGSFSSNFFNSNIRYPATNPAISAPKNPDETHCSSGRKMEVPAFARKSTDDTRHECRSVSDRHGNVSCQNREHHTKCCIPYFVKECCQWCSTTKA